MYHNKMIHDKQLYNNPLHSDIKIKTSYDPDKIWYGHKSVLRKNSETLYSKIRNDDTLCVRWNPSVVKYILKKIYKVPVEITKYNDRLTWLLEVYKAAQSWQLPKIYTMIEKHIDANITNINAKYFIILYNTGKLYDNIKKLVYKYIQQNFWKLSSELSIITFDDLHMSLYGVINNKKYAYKMFLKLKAWNKIHKYDYTSDEFSYLINNNIKPEWFTNEQMIQTNMKKYFLYYNKDLSIPDNDDDICTYVGNGVKCGRKTSFGNIHCDGHSLF
ncbi:SKP1/BTB/POZ domain-containing protein [Orpheovirus IHUMI-LCC2]|uniref:SKP1/BTB/POZ domain-containing protein n=1 Tax=Orpheovirus IHUMI-LCC2 TaxID=2023057 RepID=A0A2I2L4Y9_9VIRU|nr:SKP1/BTB/POZ domain-containing protein [Orpheovirus IHUMI-LCC2]SNW62608.1 SKP1/BTB/POZ domain-containing protein [Orpheovirus IHUMI-LCC2]